MTLLSASTQQENFCSLSKSAFGVTKRGRAYEVLSPDKSNRLDDQLDDWLEDGVVWELRISTTWQIIGMSDLQNKRFRSVELCEMNNPNDVRTHRR